MPAMSRRLVRALRCDSSFASSCAVWTRPAALRSWATTFRNCVWMSSSLTSFVATWPTSLRASNCS